jgi:hypothetical protein
MGVNTSYWGWRRDMGEPTRSQSVWPSALLARLDSQYGAVVDVREEFKKSPIQTTAAAIAIAVAAGGVFAGGLNLALPEIQPWRLAWFPIYTLGATIGIVAGLFASMAFRRTWIFGLGATIGLLFASANVSARLIGFSGGAWNGVEVFLNGALCYIGFAGVLAERAYLAAQDAGRFDEPSELEYGEMQLIMFAVMVPGMIFSGVYAGSLPNALAELIK